MHANHEASITVCEKDQSYEIQFSEGNVESHFVREREEAATSSRCLSSLDLFEVLKKIRPTAGNNEQGQGACGEKIEID